MKLNMGSVLHCLGVSKSAQIMKLNIETALDVYLGAFKESAWRIGKVFLMITSSNITNFSIDHKLKVLHVKYTRKGEIPETMLQSSAFVTIHVKIVMLLLVYCL